MMTMGDMGDDFRAMNEYKKQKRKSNTQKSTQILIDKGIKFVSLNHGSHLFVDGKIDFWPSTGKWIVRGGKKYHRGVFKLIRRLENV
jgi:hypothetical protein